MFGMDLVSIVTAALAGAAGGAIGALIASRLPETAKGLRAAVIVGFIVALPVLARPALAPHVEQYAGTWLRAGQFEALYDTEVTAELKKIPAIERLFRDYPETGKRFREQARKAYEAGGARNLLETAPAIGADALGDALMLYMPKARGEDLILFATTMADTLTLMNERDPEVCILYQFGSKLGVPLDNTRLTATIGKESQKRLVDTMNALVLNAGDTAVAHDRVKGEAAVSQLAQRHAPLLTGSSSEVATGARIYKDVAEAKTACTFAAAMFRDLATMDKATSELIMRHLYAS
jgi:hypothetical protein